MRSPSIPDPFAGSNLPSHTLGGNAPADFFGGGHGVTSEIEELWKTLEKFFEVNELAIAKAERSTMDPDRASDFGTTIDISTDTVNVVLNGLTALAQIHPALGVAIVAFHAAVSLDLTRRDNDKKVIMVMLEMQSMMCAMFQLRKLRYAHVPEEKRDMENSRLQRLIARIAEEIKACGSVLDYYTGRGTVFRVICSKVYERRFAGHIETFAQRRSELQNAVTAYTAVGMDTANIGIADIGEKMTFMNDKLDSIVVLFQTLNSARERKLLNFLEEKGGSDKCINDDLLLTRLLAMAGESKKTSTAGLDGREEEQQLVSVRRELKNDLKNLDTLLTQNFSRFERRLEITMKDTDAKFSQIVTMMIDQGRVKEKAIVPTAALTDPVLQAIWESMGLKSSVKAKKFILNFRDHILDYMGRTPLATSFGSPRPASDVDLPPTEDENEEGSSEILSNAGPMYNQIFKDELKDEWALKYLTVSYVHPIIEAMDEDCSGFISVKEANKFAGARPAGRSLISWMAYWAIGWHYNLTQYKESIYSMILQMHYLSAKALPHNQQLIKSYLNSFKLIRVEALLRSIKSLDMDMDVETDASLDEYAELIASAQEQQLMRSLDGMSYVLRSENDVKLVVNHGNQRVETWILPVLYLVLMRHLDVVALAQTELLHPNEMSLHEESIGFILNVFQERVNGLEAIFDQVYRGSVEAHFKVFAYGMFHVFFKKETNFRSDSTLHQEEWACYYETMSSAEGILAMNRPDISILVEGPGKLFDFEYEGQFHDEEREKEENSEDKDKDRTEHPSEDNNLSSVSEDADIESDHPLDGLWSVKCGDRLPFSVPIKVGEHGKITGYTSLIQMKGYITGDYKAEKGSPGGVLDFDLLMRGEEKDGITQFFSGVFDPDREVIEGTWITKAISPDEDFTHEIFTARRTPLELYHLRGILDGEAQISSDVVESVESAELARRRWRFAIECIRSQTKARTNSKKLTIARLDARRDLIKLHYESFAQGTFGEFQTSNYFQKISLGLPNSATLFTLYRNMAKYRFERMLDDCGTRFFRCDNCSEHITHVRYHCITCTYEKFDNEIDLCHRCRDVNGVISISDHENNFVHKTSHSLLRSTPHAWIKKHELAWLIPYARSVSEEVKARFRDLIASDGTSKTSDPIGGWGDKSIQAPKCLLCKKPILALPAWICMMCGNKELLCTDCVQNKRATDDGHVLLRIFDNVSVRSSEAKSMRLGEDIEDMRLRINSVAEELRALKVGLDNRMEALESQVNTQLVEILFMMK